MRLSAKARVDRSKRRQTLSRELRVWLQKEKDMEIALVLGVKGVPEKVAFIRQEQAKLRKALRDLDRGVSIQRAWANGKLLY